jgi:hypothetical protein
MLKENKFNKIYFLILLFPAALASMHLASRYPVMAERYYSRSVYRYLSQVISGITGVFPFSVAEILVILALILTIAGVVYGIAGLFKSPGKRLEVFGRQLSIAVVAISLVYFSFTAVWGLNYHRLSIASIAGLEVRPASVEELESMCMHLIDRANGLRNLVEEDEYGIMVSPKGVSDMLIRAQKGYQAVSEMYPELGGKYGRPKGVMLSKVMSYQGIGGIYFPFTAEANVNVSVPHFMIPFAATHEMAHQRGFAREDEANYIGYIAAIMHPDNDFRYSGTMAALRYSMNALGRQDMDRYNLLRAEYSDGVARDFDAWHEHWSKYEGFVSETTDRINNRYLQANGQRDGVQSYGRMVDLLLAHYRNKI